MERREYRRNGYLISTDKTRLNLAMIHRFLSEESYWAEGRPMDIVSRSVEYSLCLRAYEEGGEQVGFARAVTDFSTFAWLCDVFVLAPYRRKGLGKWLVQTIVEHPDLQGVKRILLGTGDAHTLYRAFGFEDSMAGRWMELPMAP